MESRGLTYLRAAMADPVYRLDLSIGEVHDRKRTPQGGLVADANLTRTGVFPYRNADGTTRMELRRPSEVFDRTSLDTYPLAPVTVDHPGRVGPHNWRDHAVGTVGAAVRQHGDFVRGELHLQDGKTADRAEAGDLREISCGYTCDLDPTPGEYQGQLYDAEQRNIRINHVAVGPPGWGRMGPDTRMHLDSGAAVSGEWVKDSAKLTDAAEKASKSATESSNKAAGARATTIEKGSGTRPNGPADLPQTDDKTYGHSPDHERAAGESHIEAVKAHLRAAESTSGLASASPDHHDLQARAHAHHVLSHAKNAGASWDHNKHPLQEFETLARSVISKDSAHSYVRHETATSKASTMTDEERKALEKAQADAAQAKSDLEKARQDAAAASTAADKASAKSREDAAKIATLEAENQLLKLQAKPRADAASDVAAKGAALAEEQRVEEMIQLREDARLVFATAADPDGKAWTHKGKVPDVIRREVLVHLEPSLKLDGIEAIADVGARSQALRVVYDTAMARKREVDKQNAQAQSAASGDRDDGDSGGYGDDDEEPVSAEKARKDMIKRKKDASKGLSKRDKRKAAA